MIRLIKPYISFEDVEKEYREIFESGWFTKGKYVEEFRRVIREYTGANYAHLTTSATTALMMALRALEIKPGDEVIVSDFSFPATANVVEELGAIPIFADVSLETFNMLPEELESKITEKTKAVIFVDALGNPSGIHQIKEICSRYDLPLIEDAACAIGSSEFGEKCGNIADITCFSFHPRKLLTTGEGGAITCNDETLHRFFEIKLNHGAVSENGKIEFVDFGYNYRLTELQAVMGIKQIEKLDEIVRSRNLIRDSYIEALEPLGFEVQKVSEGVRHNVQSMVFKVPEETDRDSLIAYLKQYRVESTIGTYCLSCTDYYKNRYSSIQNNSKLLEDKTLTLPCHDYMDVKEITLKIKNFFQEKSF